MRCLADAPDANVLILSLIMLFAGPVLFLALARDGAVARAVDRVIVAVLIVLVLALLLPDSFRSLGWPAFAWLLIGYGLPGMLETVARRAAETMHLATLFLALAGLMLHEMIDGAGLAAGDQMANGVLAIAIVLHRFGVGLMVWLIMQPVFGSRIAWLTLAAMALATVIGYWWSARLLPLAGTDVMLAVQAVVTGTIVHSLVHRAHLRRAAHPPAHGSAEP